MEPWGSSKMADEIVVSTRVQVINGNMKFTFDPLALSVTQNAVGGPTPGYVTIGTSEESYAFPEIATLGWFMMRNLDETNYVDWGFSTGVYGGRLQPGEWALFRFKPSTTLYLKANSAACKMQLNALEG